MEGGAAEEKQAEMQEATKETEKKPDVKEAPPMADGDMDDHESLSTLEVHTLDGDKGNQADKEDEGDKSDAAPETPVKSKEDTSLDLPELPLETVLLLENKSPLFPFLTTSDHFVLLLHVPTPRSASIFLFVSLYFVSL